MNSTDFKWLGGRLCIRFRLFLGSSGQSVGSGVTVTIPPGISLRAPSVANHNIHGKGTLFDVGVSTTTAWIRYNGTNVDRFEVMSNAATTSGTQVITSTVPLTWGAGDGMEGELIVDVA